ncbi:unnamed protein product [Arabidopsis arenosa]|uniref:Uncharacterized protein n=1 Tax=Arabidopsis arenosa TaxID=38785 RepID=A0A8S1ZNM7_ARAAE|nr:unnamed protein product [Arabidopsis arenosa]
MGISSKQKPQVSTIERNRRGDQKLNPGEQGDDVSLWRTGEENFSKKFSSKGNLRESKPRKDWFGETLASTLLRTAFSKEWKSLSS